MNHLTEIKKELFWRGHVEKIVRPPFDLVSRIQVPESKLSVRCGKILYSTFVVILTLFISATPVFAQDGTTKKHLEFFSYHNNVIEIEMSQDSPVFTLQLNAGKMKIAK